MRRLGGDFYSQVVFYHHMQSKVKAGSVEHWDHRALPETTVLVTM